MNFLSPLAWLVRVFGELINSERFSPTFTSVFQIMIITINFFKKITRLEIIKQDEFYAGSTIPHSLSVMLTRE